MQDHGIALSGGRTLGYSEQGSHDGTAIMYFHGTPGARIHPSIKIMERIAPSARIIAIDRPGYGLSDASIGRTLEDWNNDLSELADRLGIGSFSILATSGGAPFALANGHLMPGRVEKVAIVCGVGPAYMQELFSAMGEETKMTIMAALHSPERLAEQITHIHSNPAAYVRQIQENMPREQREQLSPEIVELYLKMVAESTVDPRGIIDDYRIIAQDWGIPFADMRVPIQFWHGDADKTVPITHAEYLCAQIPDATLVRLQGLDHLATSTGAVPDAMTFLLER